MTKQIEQFKELTLLSLNNCHLVSLENLPKLDSIIRVELMDNNFPMTHLKFLLAYPNLECVSLGKCDVKSIDDIKCLTTLKSLV